MNHIGRPPKREEDGEDFELEEYEVEYLRSDSPACAYKGLVNLTYVPHSGDEIFIKVRAKVIENQVEKITTLAIPVAVLALSQTDGEYDCTVLVTLSVRCRFTGEQVEALLAGDQENWQSASQTTPIQLRKIDE